MLIGLDFDNTIVCYDRLFHRLAMERGLIPESVPQTKGAVRDYLRSAGREPEWTAMQGIGYGPRIVDAEPFPGVHEFLVACKAASVRVAIVSHKTKHPYLGPKHDLHAAAHAFLTTHGFYESHVTGLTRDSVSLELTLTAKLARIGELRCDAFVDDLPELLAEPTFPTGVTKVLFDPANTNLDRPGVIRVTSWGQAAATLVGGSREVAWAA